MSKRIAVAAFLLLFAVSAFAQHGGGTPGGTMPVAPGGVTGFVTSVNGNLISVLGGWVVIDASTATIYARKGTATIADVKPGMRIVAAIANPAAPRGTPLQATSITILETSTGSLHGPVQSVDAFDMQIGIFGAAVDVTSATRIFSFRKNAATINDIRPGDLVSVEVNLVGTGLVAETIHILPPVPNASLEGTVKSISSTSWVITTANGDVTVLVNQDTRIDPNVKVGDKVHVLGITNGPAGGITALTIWGTTPRPTPPPGEPGVEGTVKSISPTAWVITTRNGDVTVTINSETKIDPTVKVGDTVVVIVKRDASGNLIAVAIMKSEKRRTVRT